MVSSIHAKYSKGLPHVRANNNKLQRMGRSIFLKYHTMYLAWNSYLRLINVDYNNCFSCPTCKTTPDTIIIDGVTLVTLKGIPKESPTTVYHVTCHVPIQDRVWITRPNNLHLKSVLKYLSTTEPISGIFQFSILNQEELALVVDLAAGIPGNINEI